MNILQQIEDQVRWIVEHGADEAGYVSRYGSRNDPDHHGDGGEAIYAADAAEFHRLMNAAIKRGLFRRQT